MTRRGRCIQVQQCQTDGGWRPIESPAKVMPGDPPGTLHVKIDDAAVTVVFGWRNDIAPVLWQVNVQDDGGYLWDPIADLSNGPVELETMSGATVRLRAVL